LLHAYAQNQPDAFGIRATDRVAVVAPMFHANGWAIPYSAPIAGAAMILAGRHLDGTSLVRLMNAERATVASGVPTIWLGVLAHLQSSGERLDTLRRVCCGGSAVPRMMLDGLAAYGVDVHQLWGMTETSPLGTTNRPTPATAHLTGEPAILQKLNQGHAVFATDIKIVGPQGAELPWDGVAFGDLKIRGPWICREYYRLGADGAADAEGWFHTGDVATIDPYGFISLVDRSKDVIKSGGEWISSITLENIAVSHPDVAEAAVIAARHPKWMERPLLLLVPKPDRAIDTAGVLALYRDRVPSWWRPDAVLVVEELPHTATGKLNKLALREKYEAHLLEREPAVNARATGSA
jgi:fatty-acyl-CoA synthase